MRTVMPMARLYALAVANWTAFSLAARALVKGGIRCGHCRCRAPPTLPVQRRSPAFDPDDKAGPLVVIDIQALRAEVHGDGISVPDNANAAVVGGLRRLAHG